jgi:adenylate cyclase
VFRMGVNLGDVIAADQTIHGDGVNVAARLEKLAEPGGLCISRNVYEQVKGKIAAAFVDLGEHQFHNIAESIRAYSILPPGSAANSSGPAAKSTLPLPDKPSIAVLPFDNMSGDPEQGYFSDGLTEDIISGLSKFRELFVIARNSSFQFRDKNIDVKEVGQKLGVQFVVEGSVRKIGNRIRVTVQLIDATSSAHIWAEKYDRDLTDVFEIQDEITRMVTTQVAGRATLVVTQRLRTRPTDSLSAYDNFLRARELFSNFETAAQAEPFVLKAIALDPGFAAAHAIWSDQCVIKYIITCRREYLEEALIAGQKAVDLDPTEPWANYSLGLALTYLRRIDEANHYLTRALALNPNDSYVLGLHANWSHYAGRGEDALRETDEALRRDPYSFTWLWNLRGHILTVAGKYVEAIDSLHRMKIPQPLTYCYLAICHIELGQLAEAEDAIKRLKASYPDCTPAQYFAIEPFADIEVSRKMLDALHRAEQAGLPE